MVLFQRLTLGVARVTKTTMGSSRTEYGSSEDSKWNGTEYFSHALPISPCSHETTRPALVMVMWHEINSSPRQARPFFSPLWHELFRVIEGLLRENGFCYFPVISCKDSKQFFPLRSCEVFTRLSLGFSPPSVWSRDWNVRAIMFVRDFFFLVQFRMRKRSGTSRDEHGFRHGFHQYCS